MRYQVAIWFIGLVACAGLGAWVAWATRLPVLPSSGAMVGAVLGVALVASFLRTFGAAPEPATARR
jgi:phosphate/sulfate permease